VVKSHSSNLAAPVAHTMATAWSVHTIPSTATVTAWPSVSPSLGSTVTVGGGARGASGSKSSGTSTAVVAPPTSSKPWSARTTHAPAGRQSISPPGAPIGPAWRSATVASTASSRVAVPEASVRTLWKSSKSQPANVPGVPAGHCMTLTGWSGAKPVAVTVTRVPSARPAAGSSVTWGSAAWAPPGAEPAASAAATVAPARPIAARALAGRRTVVMPAPQGGSESRRRGAALGATP
jgi:hypothetical protein